MNHDNNLPLALFRAQLAFWMRTGEILQESQGRWLALTQHALDRQTGDTHAETLGAVRASNWTELTSLPANAGWRFLNQGVASNQALALTAINNHTALAAGIQRALADWQRETATALTQASNSMPLSGMMKDALRAAGTLDSMGPDTK